MAKHYLIKQTIVKKWSVYAESEIEALPMMRTEKPYEEEEKKTTIRYLPQGKEWSSQYLNKEVKGLWQM